jgi:site-specific recombinase XerD
MKKKTVTSKAGKVNNTPTQDPMKRFQCYLQANVTNNKKSIKEYSYTLRFLLEYLNGKPLEQITKTDIEEFIVVMKNRYKTNSLTNRLASLRHLMKHLDIDFDIKIPSTVQTRTENDVLTEEELQKLFQATAYNPRDNAILKTLYYTGIRKAELTALNNEDIDFQVKQIIIQNGKGRNGSPETVNIHTEALDSIQKYLSVKPLPKPGPEKALFLNIDGKRITSGGIEYLVISAVKKTGIQKHVYPHMLRASLITHMSNNGANLFQIKAQSRHKTISVINRYIRPSQQERLQSYETYVPTITEKGIKPKDPEPDKKPVKKPDNDPMVGNVDEQTQLQLRLLEIEKQEIRLRLAKTTTDKDKIEIYYQ